MFDFQYSGLRTPLVLLQSTWPTQGRQLALLGEGDLCCCHHQVVNKNSLRKPCTARLTVKVAPLAPVAGAWASTADSLKTPASGQQKDLEISGVVPSTSWTPFLHLLSSGRRQEACDGVFYDSPTSPRANACPNCSS